jgi:translation elongation factor EF-1beta
MEREFYYSEAINQLCEYIFSVAENAIDYEKLDAYVDRLSKKIFKTKHKKRGKIGYGITKLPRNIYIINDDCFAGTDYLLQWLVIKAVENGVDIEIRFNKYFKNKCIDRISMPELNIAFISNNFLDGGFESENKINFSRFYLNFDKKKNKINKTKQFISELVMMLD